MADDSLEALHLSFMQDALPVGMAVIKRVKEGGIGKVAEAFTVSNDPIDELRKEGEPVAKSIREQLDKVSPGLGNPIVSVEVAVKETTPTGEDSLDQKCLIECLDRLQTGMDELENYLTEFQLGPSNSSLD